MPDVAAAEPAGLAEWMILSDAVLRGLVHALNNRLTALSAFAELSAMGDEDYAPARVLPGEIARLQEVGALVRLLATEVTPPEALELGPVLDDALALHAHHPGLRGVRCTVAHEGARIPVRVPRWALLRLVLVMMEAGKRAAEEAGRDTTVLRVSGDERWVVLHADADTLPDYALSMARLCGASAEPTDQGAMVRLPNLIEQRRREQADRDAAGR